MRNKYGHDDPIQRVHLLQIEDDERLVDIEEVVCQRLREWEHCCGRRRRNLPLMQCSLENEGFFIIETTYFVRYVGEWFFSLLYWKLMYMKFFSVLTFSMETKSVFMNSWTVSSIRACARVRTIRRESVGHSVHSARSVSIATLQVTMSTSSTVRRLAFN